MGIIHFECELFAWIKKGGGGFIIGMRIRIG